MFAGIDENKERFQELAEYLMDPSKFQPLEGRIRRGVLMSRQPGTGQTSLAKAIDGEAKVPFFSISSSDFVEMFISVCDISHYEREKWMYSKVITALSL